MDCKEIFPEVIFLMSIRKSDDHHFPFPTNIETKSDFFNVLVIVVPWVVRLYIQVDTHGITILYHLHQCRPCTSSNISC